MEIMENGKKENGKMPDIIIDEEFKSLLPALDKQTYAHLEESLLENGCMHPLVVWKGILIDGHNRYEICTKHNIPFKTVEKEFGSRDEALIWIISTQVSRRNLTPIQLSYYRGLHYNADKRLVKNAAGTNQHSKEVSYQNDNKPQNPRTVERLSDQYNISQMTIIRDSKLSKAIDAIGESSPEAKREILSGTAGITRQRLQELATGASEEEIKSIAESIEQGTYEKPKKAAAELPPDNVVFHDILDALNGVMAKIAEAYSTNIRRAENNGEVTELRTALRGHIDKLEDLYHSLDNIIEI